MESTVRAGAVPVPPRRATAGRALRRLLVLAGLMVAGWLLGGAAQAHADEAPGPVDVVADAPVVNGAIRAAQDGDVGIRGVVREVTGTVRSIRPVPGDDGEPPEPAVPAVPATGDPAAKAGKGGEHGPEHGPERGTGGSWAPRRPAAGTFDGRAAQQSRVAAITASGASKSAGIGPSTAPAPFAPAPVQAGTSPVSIAGPILFGGFGGVLSRRLRAPDRPKPVPLRALGELPPDVRTAADEPSFAPD